MVSTQIRFAHQLGALSLAPGLANRWALPAAAETLAAWLPRLSDNPALRLEALLQSARVYESDAGAAILRDAAPEYASVAAVKRRLEEWKRRQPASLGKPITAVLKQWRLLHAAQSSPSVRAAFSSDFVRLLQLLCEGHNTEAQDFLRVQPNQASTHDLVTEVYELLAVIEPELDGDNSVQARKCIETLTELVQGNTSLGNSQLLLQTKAHARFTSCVLVHGMGGTGKTVR